MVNRLEYVTSTSRCDRGIVEASASLRCMMYTGNGLGIGHSKVMCIRVYVKQWLVTEDPVSGWCVQLYIFVTTSVDLILDVLVDCVQTRGAIR